MCRLAVGTRILVLYHPDRGKWLENPGVTAMNRYFYNVVAVKRGLLVAEGVDHIVVALSNHKCVVWPLSECEEEELAR